MIDGEIIMLLVSGKTTLPQTELLLQFGGFKTDFFTI